MLSSMFNDLHLEGHFCDAFIKVKDVRFHIHKVILSQCSDYFRALFKCGSTSNQKVFELHGLSPDVMQLIIEFAYTRSVSVTEDNVQELLLAADQFNLMDIAQACFDFLGDQLSPDNCIGIWQLTNICFSSELKDKAYLYILDHFEQVVCCEEFRHLSVWELAKMLERDELNVRLETTVYEAVLRWIAHAPEERKEHLFTLMPKVRLDLTTECYTSMTAILNELLLSNTECRDQVIDSYINSAGPSLSGLCQTRPRLPNAILFAIGGLIWERPCNIIEAYDIRANCWMYVTGPPGPPRAYHGTAFLNGFVYSVGGFDSDEYFNSVCRLDLSTHTWHEVAPMYFRRCHVSVTVLNGCIYALGGYDGDVLNTAERYTPETNQWSRIAPMHEKRANTSCTTLHHKVYICGGVNGNEALQNCEYYSPPTDQWTVITPMIGPRMGIGVIAYADQVYAVGGSDGVNHLCRAEAYNPRTNAWRTLSPMMYPRSNFGIGVINDLLFVVGGFDSFTTLNFVEFYNATTDKWDYACDLKICRRGLSCCVVSGLPFMKKYTFPRDVAPC